ncbi:MAG TPA: tyrosine--tRNA ligase, partial [Clostridium sp.]|nr:tyrosine--tRNA ligase [Clostridium sp.]
GRRLIEQGGLTINDIKIEDVNETFNEGYLEKDGYALIKRGKKKFYKLVLA